MVNVDVFYTASNLFSWERITQTIVHSIKNTKDLTMKQMFDISEKLIAEQSDEIYGINTISWEDSSWNIYLWLVMKKSSVSCTRRFTYFQILRYALERWARTHSQTLHGEDRLTCFKSSPQYRTLDKIDGEPVEFEWNIFPGFTTLQLSQEVKHLLLGKGETPENFTGRIIFMSMFNEISCGSKDNKKECESKARLVSLYAKRFGTGHWSFLGPCLEKKWYSINADSPQGE